jgi:hypothetical protein
MNATITLTFGDQAENHVGMQKIGKLAEEGLSIGDLKEVKARYEAHGFKCELVNLNTVLPSELVADQAAVLIIRNGVNYKINDLSDKIFSEQLGLEWDTKAKMKGRVVNKRARHNLTYSDKGQEPDYENGKGRIVAWGDIPFTRMLIENFETNIGPKANDLVGEGNLYYDVSKCGIGWHGDTERKKVIAVRLGETLSLKYQWFYWCHRVADVIEFKVNHGDIYIMSEKASGFDWKKKKILTLRHATGCQQFVKATKPLITDDLYASIPKRKVTKKLLKKNKK